MNRIVRVIRLQLNKKLVGMEMQLANRTALSLPQLAEALSDKVKEWGSVKLNIDNDASRGYNLLHLEIDCIGYKKPSSVETSDFHKIESESFLVNIE